MTREWSRIRGSSRWRRGYATDGHDHRSQEDRVLLHGFPEVGAERFRCEHVHVDSELAFQSVLKVDQVEEGSSLLHLDQEIEITSLRRLSTCIGPEESDGTRTMLTTDCGNPLASLLGQLHCSKIVAPVATTLLNGLGEEKGEGAREVGRRVDLRQ